MTINIYNQTDEDLSLIIPYLEKTFSLIDNSIPMELIIIDDLEMIRLNQTYRNLNKTTDVLSFPNDEEEIESLGDVFINYKQASIQASEYNHSLIREFCFLAVHGYLHLIGYDHETEVEAKVMFNLQEEILNNANIRRDK